jgi:hypothetical protein
MNDVTTETNKPKEDDISVEELLQENKQNPEVMDGSIFDETLKEINQILSTLEQKSEVEQEQLGKLKVLPEIKSAISKIHQAKDELVKEDNNLIKNNNLLKRIEELEKNINNPNKGSIPTNELKNETLTESKEHSIDKNLLSIGELHDFEKKDEILKKSSFGFYSYLILIVFIFFALYGLLNISKDLIIYKYPMTEPYIQYFYEIIEVLKFSILSVADFIKNKI